MAFATVAIIGAAAGLAQIGIGLSRRSKAKGDLEDAQKLQAEAEQMYLGQEQQLQAQLDNTLNQIQNLSGGRDVESVNLSDKQLMELANFQLQVENTRKQLREVRRNLSKDIDRLANQINILNTFLIPVLLILLMFFIPRQLGIRKRKSR